MWELGSLVGGDKRGKNMKPLQLCISSIAIITACGQSAMAAAPELDDWTLINGDIKANDEWACFAGYTCGNSITGNGFFQRQVTDSSGNDFFQTIITDSSVSGSTGQVSFGDESFEKNNGASQDSASEVAREDYFHLITTLPCFEGYVCGDTIIGDNFRLLERGDSDSVHVEIAMIDSETFSSIYYYSWDSSPFHLTNTDDELSLSPGQQLGSFQDLSTANKNLQLERHSVTKDPDYFFLNQQSGAQQLIYEMLVDVKISGLTTGGSANMVTQLNTPLHIPEQYDLKPRMLIGETWANFVTDEHNYLGGAKKLEAGFCPEIDSDFFENEFNAGSECLRITVQDGGENDSDAEENGSVNLTLGFILKVAEAPSTVSEIEDSSVSIQAQDTSAIQNISDPGAETAENQAYSSHFIYQQDEQQAINTETNRLLNEQNNLSDTAIAETRTKTGGTGAVSLWLSLLLLMRYRFKRA